MGLIDKLFGKKPPTAPVEMSVKLEKEANNLFVLRISGVFANASLDRVQALAAQKFDAGITGVKVLLILTHFQGWKHGDDWGDLNFFMQYEKNIAKIAVVGEARWETEMRLFLASGHRTGDVRYFLPGQEVSARAWLNS